MNKYQDFILNVKQHSAIEQVIESFGDEFQLGRHLSSSGWVTGIAHDSLNVNIADQYYVWWAAPGGVEKGDVFNWIKARNPGWDFSRALDFLAQRAGIQKPAIDREMSAAEHEQRSREDAWGIAQSVFAHWLQEDDEAMEYAEKRGWTPETIQHSGIGFSGRNTEKQRAQMVKAFLDICIQPDHPAAVVVLGFSGPVAKWAEKWQIEPRPNWLQHNFITGLMHNKRLIYPHMISGRVTYFSSRNILGDDKGTNGKKFKSFNPAGELTGNLQLYFNHLYSHKTENLVIVEGPADAISLAQLGQPAVALMGVDTAPFIDTMKILRQRHPTLYWGLDSDQAGADSLRSKDGGWPAAELLGPRTRWAQWNSIDKFQVYTWDDEEHPIKDANDLLRAMTQSNTSHIVQRRHLQELLGEAPMMISLIAEWTASKKGAFRDKAEQEAIAIIAQLSDSEWVQYRTELSHLLQRSLRDMEAMLKRYKQSQSSPAQTEADMEEATPTLGGWIQEHLVEYLYDPKTQTPLLAVRFPDGHSQVVPQVVIDHQTYIPIDPEPLILKEVVRFPSELEELLPTRELLTRVRTYIHDYLDIDPFFERVASFYVLFSWLYDAFPVLPYLRALGDYGTGKTRFIETIGMLCYRPLFTAGATSTSALFRMMEQYRGTLILDEADFAQSDEQADIIKILNVGNRRSGNVIKSVDGGNGTFIPTPFSVFCPKIIATRKKFGDEATESRCLTKEMGSPTLREDIPLVEPRLYYSQALEIRNFLLAYRMRYWQPEIEVNYNAADRSVEPRLNQMALPLKTLIGADEPELIEEIDAFVKRYNHQILIERSMRPEAKVVQAIVQLAKQNGSNTGGEITITLKEIAERANRLMDSENADEEDGESGTRKLTPKGVGSYIRKTLQLGTDRKMNGYCLVWDQKRIEALMRRYGVE